jgi:hypothetical protein
MRRALHIGAFMVVVLQAAAIADADPLILSGFATLQGTLLSDFAFRSERFDLHHFAPGEFSFGLLPDSDLPCSTQACEPGLLLASVTVKGFIAASGVIDGKRFDTIHDEDISDDPIEGVSLGTTLRFAFDRPFAVPPGDTTVISPFTLSGHITGRPGPRFETVVLDSDVESHGTARIHFRSGVPDFLPEQVADLSSFTFGEAAATPEPATWVLMLAGLPLLACLREHRG